MSTLLCSWSGVDLSSLDTRLKSESEISSISDDDSEFDKQLIGMAKDTSPVDELFSRLLKSVTKNCPKDLFKDDNSEEAFNSHVNRNVMADLNKQNVVDKLFVNRDDPYEKFVKFTPKTPRNRTLKLNKLFNSSYENCEIRQIKRTDEESCVPSGFSTDKPTIFQCSTPKTTACSDCKISPLLGRTHINTPISGIKKLKCLSVDKNDTLDSYSFNSTPQKSNLSLDETYSPVRDLPPEIRKTILTGIICYVDVKSDNEDASSAVQAELLTLGARVEKNFTKKVTHVVFKEGRNGTYLKAKKEGIPLVSVLWIEACKRVRGIVDPAQHPPRKMQKYERILPFQTIKKRRLKFFNPNSKIRKIILENLHDPTFIPVQNGRILAARKAATVCKGSTNKQNTVTKKPCTKKLLFEKPNNILTDEKRGLGEKVISQKITEVGELDHSSFDSMPDIASNTLRRNSAPGKLLFKKNINENHYTTEYQEDGKININSSGVQEIIGMEGCTEKLSDDLSANVVADPPFPRKKKRKLFDPSQKDISFEERYSVNESVEKPVRKARTRATASKLVKLVAARKRRNDRIKTDPDVDDDGSSASTFVTDLSDVSQKNNLRKRCRSIVFTSVPRSDLPKYVEMVKKLGRFIVENDVTKKTTHVLCNGPRRTLNLISGIARGCWLLDLKWLEDSIKSGQWLPEDDYLLSEDYPCIVDCCKERRSLKSSHVVSVFKGVGSVYVSRSANPPKKNLDKLLKICCATFSQSSSTADIKVGGSKPNPNPSGIWISEKWIIDSISQNTLKPFDIYLIKPGNNGI